MHSSSLIRPLLGLALSLAATPLFAQGGMPYNTTGKAAIAAQPALDDPTIVAILDAANTWDMETGGLVLKKSRNKEVRRFAAMMVSDHRTVRTLGRDLAKKLNLTPTLRGKKGAAFDKAYIEHEVSYHQAVIDAVTTLLLPATKNAELRDLQTTVCTALPGTSPAASRFNPGYRPGRDDQHPMGPRSAAPHHFLDRRTYEDSTNAENDVNDRSHSRRV